MMTIKTHPDFLLLLIDGGKGGDGKSTTAGLACAALERAGRPYLVIDTDDSNADVARAQKATVRCAERPDALCVKIATHAIGVGGERATNAWAAMLTNIESMRAEHPSGAVVVSNGARLLVPYISWGRMLESYSPKTLWVVDTTYASLENLMRYRQAWPFADVTVVLNGGAGGGDATEDDFTEWHGSGLKASGIPSFYLPPFGLPGVLRRFSNDGVPLLQLLDDPALTVGQRIMYSYWLEDAVAQISAVITPGKQA